MPDAYINTLLKFLCTFFKLLGLTSTHIASVAATIPTSVYKLQRCTDSSNHCISYVVCPKCQYLCKYDDCLGRTGTRTYSKTCSFVQFPNHVQGKFRSECGHLLLKRIVFSSGKILFYPFKVYILIDQH